MAPPVAYTLEISHFQRVLRVCSRDTRILNTQMLKLRECIDEITRILSSAQTKQI
jgi:hypothetical protein